MAWHGLGQPWPLILCRQRLSLWDAAAELRAPSAGQAKPTAALPCAWWPGQLAPAGRSAGTKHAPMRRLQACKWQGPALGGPAMPFLVLGHRACHPSAAVCSIPACSGGTCSILGDAGDAVHPPPTHTHTQNPHLQDPTALSSPSPLATRGLHPLSPPSPSPPSPLGPPGRQRPRGRGGDRRGHGQARRRVQDQAGGRVRHDRRWRARLEGAGRDCVAKQGLLQPLHLGRGGGMGMGGKGEASS